MPKAKVIAKVRVKEDGKFVTKEAGEVIEVSEQALAAMPTRLKAVADKPKGGAK